MPDATAGAQGLHVSGANLTAATGIVLVVEYAFADVRDDLHVSVRMHRKTAVRSDLIVIQDHEIAEARVRRVALAVDREVVSGLEPVVIPTSKGVPSSKLQHWCLSSGLVLRSRLRRWRKAIRATVGY